MQLYDLMLFYGIPMKLSGFYGNLLDWDGTLAIWKGLNGISMNFIDFCGMSGHFNVILWI